MRLTTSATQLIAYCLLLLALPACSQATDSLARQIDISGRSEIKAVPDIISVNLSFSEQSREPAGAKRLVDTQVTNLIKLCEKLGIKEKDIEAAQLQLYPQYDYKRQRQLIGYQVQRNVTIKVRDLAQYPKLLEGAVGVGASHSGAITMDYSNREQLQEQAMLVAFRNARHKAQLLAKEADGSLGKVLSIREQGSVNFPRPRARTLAVQADAEASYPTGEQTITGHILVTFELK